MGSRTYVSTEKHHNFFQLKRKKNYLSHCKIMGCLQYTYQEKTTTFLKVVQGKTKSQQKTCAGAYKYGFNGHEKDDEIAGSGNHVSWGDYGMDPRIGRRWNIDPQWQRISGQSPYSLNNNSPLSFTDPDGEFGFVGALIGAAVELGTQMAANALTGQKLTDIDWADVAVAGAIGAVSGGLGNIAKAGKAVTKLAKAAGLSGKVTEYSIKGGIKFTEEGIKAAVDINIKTDENEELDFKLRAVWRKGDDIKDLKEAASELVVGVSFDILKNGVVKQVNKNMKKTLSKSQTEMLDKLNKNKRASSKVKEKAAGVFEERFDIQQKMNEKAVKGGI